MQVASGITSAEVHAKIRSGQKRILLRNHVLNVGSAYDKTIMFTEDRLETTTMLTIKGTSFKRPPRLVA
jgi:hypothetical protein